MRISIKILTPTAMCLLAAMAVSVRAQEGATRAAVQVAYGREVEARTLYLAFAKYAEREGKPAIACLFRAAARGESIHAARHAAHIERFGDHPVARLREFVMGSTAENLTTAIELEVQERLNVYPILAEYARAELKYDPLHTFVVVGGAEWTHEMAFRTALHELESEPGWLASLNTTLSALLAPRGPKETTYWVCLGDGSVYSHQMSRCPNCGAGGKGMATCRCGN